MRATRFSLFIVLVVITSIPSSLTAQPHTQLSLQVDSAWAELCTSVDWAGDVDGDGYDDVIVGAYAFDGPDTDEGRAFVFMGSASGLSETAAWFGESDQANALFGVSVSSAGDVNRDGYDDVVVSAPTFDGDQTANGRVYLFLGSSTGLNESSIWTKTGTQQNEWYGTSVSSAGDFNADGYDDVLVGAYLYDDDQVDEGRAVVFLGSDTGLESSSYITLYGDQPGAQLGLSVSSAGDVNGDGVSDIVVGSPFFESEEMQLSEGQALVVLGCWDPEGDLVCNPGYTGLDDEGPDPDPAPDAGPDPAPDPAPDAGPDPDPGPDAGPDPDPDAGPDPGPAPDAGSEVAPDSAGAVDTGIGDSTTALDRQRGEPLSDSSNTLNAENAPEGCGCESVRDRRAGLLQAMLILALLMALVERRRVAATPSD